MDIPGSSPDWRAANMKTKGRAMPADVPPSHLGGSASGRAAWGTGKADTVLHQSRRHFHASELAQTTAWDCLPCVDAADKQTARYHTCAAPDRSSSGSRSTAETGSNSGSDTQPGSSGCKNSNGQAPADGTSQSLQLANKQWRRHRREVPAPPCLDRPQGKRMLPNTAPPSTCKELLQDPQPAQHASTARAARPAAAGSAAAPGTATPSAAAAAASTVQAAAQQPAQGASVSWAFTASSQDTSASCSSRVKATTHTSSAGSLPVPGARGLTSSSSRKTASGAQTAAAAAAASQSRRKKGPRVEDNTDFFRTPKDPPTMQRFAASLAQMSLSAGGATSSVVQRHEAGIRSRQQAQVAAAAREVAALDAGAPADD